MGPKFRSNEQRQEAFEQDFIPYACHYDPSTLLTKNGELLQTIKIVGFSYESVNKGDQTISLRRALRKAVLESIHTNNFAIWFHTVRRKKDLTTGGKYPEEGFAEYVNKEWCKRHDWEHKYINELYVTIIREGQKFNISGLTSFFRSLSIKAEKKYREKYLKDSFEDLNSTVEKLLNNLHEYGARRLTMVEKDGITYSEPITFIGKILKLKETPMPAPVMDISDYLSDHYTSIGFSVMEIIEEGGQKHYGAILSVKEYHELTSSAIDEFLQLDQEFIITESFDFINNELVQKKYEHQKYILSLSNDKIYGKVSGLDNILSSNRNLPTDYGEHQILVMLIEDDLKMLEEETRRIIGAFHELGIMVVREDVMFEDCYWAQLPGNFQFLRRRSSINTAHVGGFASLYNFPAGLLAGNHWGNAVTVFYTKANTPYFFNFHDGDNGHTTIIGPYGAGKTVLMNFLVSEAIKFNPRIYLFDHHRAGELFIRALEGNYKRIMKDSRSNKMRFNPLRMEDRPETRQFLKLWLYYLMMDENYQVSDDVRNKLEKAVEYNFGLPQSDRKLANIAAKFWPISEEEVARQNQRAAEITREKNRANVEKMLKDAAKAGEHIEEEILTLPETAEGRLALWYGQGKYAHFFDNAEDMMDLTNRINGFDVTEVEQEKWPVIPLISYMLHRIKLSLDGSPAIVILDEAWKMVDNPIMGAQLGEWLDKMRQRNAIVIFATESVEDASKSSITRKLIEKIATQIFLPNDSATAAYKEVFGLSEKEYEMLKSMSGEERNFLLKHHGNAVVAKLNLSGMNEIISVLSSTRENIALVESIILEVGDDPKKWFKVFKERTKK